MMKRFFLIVGLGVLTGAFICSFLPVAMMAALCLTAAFLFLLGLFVWWRKRGNYAMILSLFLGCFLLSATLYYQQETKVYLPLQQLNGVETAAVSTVEDISLRDGGKYTYLVKIESVSGMDLPRSRVSCLIYSSRSLELAIGDEISAVMTFYLPAEGNSRTLQNYYKSDRIFLCASLSDAEQLEITPASFSIKRKLYSLRREWQTLFYEHLSEDGAAVLSTMILGLDEDVSYPLEQNYMDAGMIHLFAISGIHMMLFAGIAERVFSLLFRQKKTSWTSTCRPVYHGESVRIPADQRCFRLSNTKRMDDLPAVGRKMFPSSFGFPELTLFRRFSHCFTECLCYNRHRLFNVLPILSGDYPFCTKNS